MSVIGVAVLPVVVAVVRGWRRSCKNTSDGSYCSTNGSTEGRAVTTTSGSTDCSPTACADETAPDKTLHGIVWVGAGGEAEDQPDRDQAGENS
jgi:hypothetical protein